MNKREEERNEKIIRGLMKLPPNRRCINCNSLGPQYVCTTFWTFVCMTCSGIHREFTHRVKSVSMAKFTKQEVEALQNGGNQRAREFFLKDWDMQRIRLPDGSNAERIREFIRNVYVNKKYAGGRSSDKLPGDMESYQSQEQRRASSYHSYSQSPPYDNQYEDRRYGKQTGMLNRRLGSDRGLASCIRSSGRLRELTFEDRFANESSGSRLSDFSVSSAGDQFRYDGPSPNSQDSGYCSPSSRQLWDMLDEDARPHMISRHADANVKREFNGIPPPQRTASLGSFRSIDSNSTCRKSVDSSGQVDVVQEPMHSTGALQAVAPAFPSISSSASMPATNQKFSSQPFVQSSMPSTAPSIDLFADMNRQSLFTPLDKNPSAVPSDVPPENGGWATFDIPHYTGLASTVQMGISAIVPSSNETCKGSLDASTSPQSNSRLFSVQNSMASGLFSQTSDQWHAGLQENKRSADMKSSQSWSTFDDSTGNTSLSLFESLRQDNRSQFSAAESSVFGNPNVGLKVSQDFVKDEFEKYSLPDAAPPDLGLPLGGMVGTSFPPSSVHPLTGGVNNARKSTNPFDLPYDADQEANTAFLDMSSLQSALPNTHSPTYVDGLAQPWLAYIPGQAPSSQLPNLPPQGPVASLGGNPFS